MFMLAACTTAPVKKPAPVPVVQLPAVPAPIKLSENFRAVTFAELPGWADDDVRQAWPAFLASCDVLIKRPVWQDVCKRAVTIDANDLLSVRDFFESQFIPHQVSNPDGSVSGMITGYYEPLLKGSRTRNGAFQTALYQVPDDLITVDLASLYPELKSMRLRGRLVGKKIVPYFSRSEIMQQNKLAGKELLWVDNPLEAFFLQVQGSGRVYIANEKETVRVAYADQNGHVYKSIGRYLVDQGELTLEQASYQSIVAWAAAHPERLQELLNVNPSFVFFREEKLTDASKGPKGALGVPLTEQRSVAIDPQFIPLGAPVFLATTMPNSEIALRRLMLAQDTGGAIRSAVRADFFWGFGADAGEKAGKMKQAGMLWVLMPKAPLQPVGINGSN